MKRIVTLTTNMVGFQKWMKEHPRKRTDGFFLFNGKELTHEQIKRIVDYAVEKGYRTDADIPEDEILELLRKVDEMIRKALIRFHLSTIDIDGIKGEEILAWLEKQGKQKPIIDGILTATNFDKVFQSCNVHKFKVGDWIVQENIGVYKIIEVCESWYEVIDVEDNHYSIGFDKEYMLRLWTIKDAKDGDVLATLAGAFIYNGNNGGGSCPGSYCGINTLGKFKTGVRSHWTTEKKIYPATKEQRNLLFQKMHEAGYEWDDEKK